jgi:3-hydroxyacyl-[acyl-carrier-protein] dehydratase
MSGSQETPCTLNQKTQFEIRDIMRLLSHRYPFLLVDRVTRYEMGVSLTAIKNVTYNEPFFVGHFPLVPTMPGVLMLEALAQACGLLAVLDSGVRPESGHILYFAGIDEARFKRVVVPGDQLTLFVELEKTKRNVWKFKTRASVGKDAACEALMTCVLKHPDEAKGEAKAKPETGE